MSVERDRMCLICMDCNLSSTISLFNKKNRRKTETCLNYEKLTNLQISNSNKLPCEICVNCVADLNKCFNFREKCIRTYNTLKDLYDDVDEEEQEEDRHRKPESMDISDERIINLPREEFLNELKQDQMVESSSKLIDLTSLLAAQTKHTDNYENANDNDKKSENEEGVILVYCIDETESATVEEENASTSKCFYKCSMCDLEFARKKNLENHFQRYHVTEQSIEPSQKQLKLQLTKEKSENVEVKQKLLENPEAKKCKFCNAPFASEKSLKIHEKKQNCKVDNYECLVCQKVFTNLELFNDHKNSHNTPQSSETISTETPKKYKCDFENCSKSFNMIGTLKDHMRTHDNSKPFICKICNRGFSQNTNLKQHIRRHNQIKAFKCNFDNTCDKAFVSKGELDSHMRKHSGAHPFECELCHSKFTTSSSLVKHRRIHSGEKPYSCEFCPLRFTALGTLKNHEKTHTGERPYSCQFCSKSFAQKSDMKSHERIHTLSKPYECSICKMSFQQSGTLKTHMKIHSKSSNTNSLADESNQ